MTKRKFYKTKWTIEVLSEDPIPTWMELENIIHEAKEGEFSMRESVDTVTELNGEQSVKALHQHGSDPEFFNLDEKGDDLKEQFDTE